MKVAKNTIPVIKIAQQLVQTPSISGKEEEIQKFIFEFLKNLKLSPRYVGPNVVCKINGKDKTKALIFNGHVDTVSPGNIKMWNHEPFSGDIVDNKLFGLGSSDMKSGVACLLELAKYYATKQPAKDLWFHFVVKEETDGSGTKEVMQWFSKNYKNQYQDIAGVIAEPTNFKKIEIAHKGNIFLKITTYGDGGHGSEPEKIKKNAVLEMYKIATRLKLLVDDWSKIYNNDLLGFPTVSLLTSIVSGDLKNPNKVADSCTATFDIRYIPEMEGIILKLLQKELVTPFVKVESVYPPVASGYTSCNEKIVILSQKISGLQVGVTPGSTDLVFFTKEGIPAIILGPGNKEKEHQIDEYCNIKNLGRTLKVYKKIISIF
jgi:succinyl-diaminopimelate desuccinylase